jgi:hypothetical protein
VSTSSKVPKSALLISLGAPLESGNSLNLTFIFKIFLCELSSSWRQLPHRGLVEFLVSGRGGEYLEKTSIDGRNAVEIKRVSVDGEERKTDNQAENR